MNLEELAMLKENLELLSNGRDPKTGYRLEDTVLNSSFNQKVLKDAALIIDQLLKLDFNPTKIDKRRKYAFCIPENNRNNIVISEEPITISAFTYSINDCVDRNRMRGLQASQITKWLTENGYLEETEAEDGKKFKVLTEKGRTIGISSKKQKSEYGRVYDVNLYNADAQRFIIEHLSDISERKEIL